mmetsp:Transcript_8609/g.23137  ORF Transcript_8609/g.23137 Transcript_8609/m.23137 type:complete len:612 (-) Transcript_8609:233-2068(-)
MQTICAMQGMSRLVMSACSRRLLNLLRSVLERGIVVSEIEPFWEDSPLSLCIRSNFGDGVRLLLEHKASARKTEVETGRAPLHIAAAYGQHDIVEALLKCGAGVDTTDKGGLTPLHHAVISGRVGAARSLLAAGARTDITDANGRTAAECIPHELLSDFSDVFRASEGASGLTYTPPFEGLAVDIADDQKCHNFELGGEEFPRRIGDDLLEEVGGFDRTETMKEEREGVYEVTGETGSVVSSDSQSLGKRKGTRSKKMDAGTTSSPGITSATAGRGGKLRARKGSFGRGRGRRAGEVVGGSGPMPNIGTEKRGVSSPTAPSKSARGCGGATKRGRGRGVGRGGIRSRSQSDSVVASTGRDANFDHHGVLDGASLSGHPFTFSGYHHGENDWSLDPHRFDDHEGVEGANGWDGVLQHSRSFTGATTSFSNGFRYGDEFAGRIGEDGTTFGADGGEDGAAFSGRLGSWDYSFSPSADKAYSDEGTGAADQKQRGHEMREDEGRTASRLPRRAVDLLTQFAQRHHVGEPKGEIQMDRGWTKILAVRCNLAPHQVKDWVRRYRSKRLKETMRRAGVDPPKRSRVTAATFDTAMAAAAEADRSKSEKGEPEPGSPP